MSAIGTRLVKSLKAICADARRLANAPLSQQRFAIGLCIYKRVSVGMDSTANIRGVGMHSQEGMHKTQED